MNQQLYNTHIKGIITPILRVEMVSFIVLRLCHLLSKNDIFSMTDHVQIHNESNTIQSDSLIIMETALLHYY